MAVSALDKTLDRILQEVHTQVFSSEDLLPTNASTHITGEEHLEPGYRENGTLFLEKLEHFELIISLRKICEKSAEMLGVRQSSDTDIAIAHFGLGECGEKNTLAGVKMALAGIKNTQLFCHNNPYVETAGASVKQCHQLVVMQVTSQKIRTIGKAHNFLCALQLCQGFAIDAFFRFRCPLSQIGEQPALVNYLTLNKISRIAPEFCVETSESPVQEAEIRMHNARQIYTRATQLLAQEVGFPFIKDARGNFIAQKKSDLVAQTMQRHFTSFQWVTDLESRGAYTDGNKEEIQQLEEQLTTYGFMPCIQERRGRRKPYHTLELKNPPFSALYKLEVQTSLPTCVLNVAASIASYLASPFTGLRLNAFGP